MRYWLRTIGPQGKSLGLQVRGASRGVPSSREQTAPEPLRLPLTVHRLREPQGRADLLCGIWRDDGGEAKRPDVNDKMLLQTRLFGDLRSRELSRKCEPPAARCCATPSRLQSRDLQAPVPRPRGLRPKYYPARSVRPAQGSFETIRRGNAPVRDSSTRFRQMAELPTAPLVPLTLLDGATFPNASARPLR